CVCLDSGWTFVKLGGAWRSAGGQLLARVTQAADTGNVSTSELTIPGLGFTLPAAMGSAARAVRLSLRAVAFKTSGSGTIQLYLNVNSARVGVSFMYHVDTGYMTHTID